MQLVNQDRKFTSINFDKTTSTQSEALKLFNKAGCGNFIVTAKMMTNGRGRNGNIWIAKEGNLNFTMFISSNLDLINLTYLPFALSLALSELINELLDKTVKISIKWPNDILIDGKKLAGILVETGLKAASKKLYYLNIGMGINIENHPKIADRETTSLSEYSNKLFKASELIEPLRMKILLWLDKVNEYQWSDLKKLWLERAYHFGREIITTYKNEKISGIFEDLGTEGELVMRLHDDQKIEIKSGIVEIIEKR